MIYWTHSTFTQDTLNNFEEQLNDILSNEEIRSYRKLIIPKRRNEWLASRVLAKILISQVLEERDLALCQIEIHKESSGMPYVVIEEKRVGRLSLSHSGQTVIIAFSTDPKASVGVDVESLEQRTGQMTDLFFTPYESRWVDSLSGRTRILAQNLVWSAKESYLKAVGKGLQMDTRSVTISDASDLSNFPKTWQSLSFSTKNQDELKYSLVYRVGNETVMTLCSDHTRKLEFVAIDLQEIPAEISSCVACNA